MLDATAPPPHTTVRKEVTFLVRRNRRQWRSLNAMAYPTSSSASCSLRSRPGAQIGSLAITWTEAAAVEGAASGSDKGAHGCACLTGAATPVPAQAGLRADGACQLSLHQRRSQCPWCLRLSTQLPAIQYAEIRRGLPSRQGPLPSCWRQC